MKIVVTENLICPRCGAEEVEDSTLPVKEWRFNIRAYKVSDDKGVWWSQCMVCAEAGEKGKGWFK
jgi:ribosomal protein S27AE